MIKQCWITLMRPVNDEGGFTLIAALLLLLLLSIIGVTAISTSMTETMVSSSDDIKRTAFYVAEAGVEHATAMLRSQFVAKNQAAISAALAAGAVPQPRWSFALNGGNDVTPKVAQPQPDPGSQWAARFKAGVPWIEKATLPNLNGYTYNVNVWNNPDPLPASTDPEKTDTDGLIVVGAIAEGPRNSRAAIEVVLNGAIDQSSATAAYTAQAGAGAGKNYNAADAKEISSDNLGALSSNANLK